MKILQWTLAVIGTIALALVGAGFLLPSKFHVERSTQVRAPAAKVYDQIADPRQWERWSAWSRRDPAMDIRYSGPLFGQGAKWSWKSRSEGAGRMHLVRVEPNRRIEYALHFLDFNLMSGGAFVLDESAGGTRVTWTHSGDVGPNPLRHYLAWQMDMLVGPDFEQGLENLKALVEKP
jgi:uncharacterized protein YndB with AHSA1/START domain